MTRYFNNMFLLLGSIIGAGIFSLPVGLKHGGLLVFIVLLIVIGYLMGQVNILYREIVDHTHAKHQLSGYANVFLGRHMGKLTLFLQLFSLYGALLAYLILGGQFLGSAFHTGVNAGSFFIFLMVAAIMIFGARSLVAFDVFFSVVKIVLLTLIAGIALAQFVPNSFKSFELVGDNWLVAYGGILFALTGFSIIPELLHDKRINGSIYGAQVISVVLYLFFALSLLPFLKGDVFTLNHPWQQFIFNIAGFFAVFTPYLLLSWVVYDVMVKDLRLHKVISLGITLLVPVLLYSFGVQSFSTVISVTGGVFLGGTALIISWIYQKKFPGKRVVTNYLIQVVFLVGIIAEVVGYLLKK